VWAWGAFKYGLDVNDGGLHAGKEEPGLVTERVYLRGGVGQGSSDDGAVRVKRVYRMRDWCLTPLKGRRANMTSKLGGGAPHLGGEKHPRRLIATKR